MAVARVANAARQSVAAAAARSEQTRSSSLPCRRGGRLRSPKGFFLPLPLRTSPLLSPPSRGINFIPCLIPSLRPSARPISRYQSPLPLPPPPLPPPPPAPPPPPRRRPAGLPVVISPPRCADRVASNDSAVISSLLQSSAARGFAAQRARGDGERMNRRASEGTKGGRQPGTPLTWQEGRAAGGWFICRYRGFSCGPPRRLSHLREFQRRSGDEGREVFPLYSSFRRWCFRCRSEWISLSPLGWMRLVRYRIMVDVAPLVGTISGFSPQCFVRGEPNAAPSRRTAKGMSRS